MVRVLIVDDAKFMRLTLSNIFTKNNYEIVGLAENGQEAIELYKELSPDIVTLDITMPVVDGIQALKEIISFDPNAKVVMCSAMGQQKLVVEAIELGAKDFIVKPFDEERVISTITQILESTASLTEKVEEIPYTEPIIAEKIESLGQEESVLKNEIPNPIQHKTEIDRRPTNTGEMKSVIPDNVSTDYQSFDSFDDFDKFKASEPVKTVESTKVEEDTHVTSETSRPQERRPSLLERAKSIISTGQKGGEEAVTPSNFKQEAPSELKHEQATNIGDRSGEDARGSFPPRSQSIRANTERNKTGINIPGVEPRRARPSFEEKIETRPSSFEAKREVARPSLDTRNEVAPASLDKKEETSVSFTPEINQPTVEKGFIKPKIKADSTLESKPKQSEVPSFSDLQDELDSSMGRPTNDGKDKFEFPGLKPIEPIRQETIEKEKYVYTGIPTYNPRDDQDGVNPKYRPETDTFNRVGTEDRKFEQAPRPIQTEDKQAVVANANQGEEIPPWHRAEIQDTVRHQTVKAETSPNRRIQGENERVRQAEDNSIPSSLDISKTGKNEPDPFDNSSSRQKQEEDSVFANTGLSSYLNKSVTYPSAYDYPNDTVETPKEPEYADLSTDLNRYLNQAVKGENKVKIERKQESNIIELRRNSSKTGSSFPSRSSSHNTKANKYSNISENTLNQDVNDASADRETRQTSRHSSVDQTNEYLRKYTRNDF